MDRANFDFHKHKCTYCGLVYEHHDMNDASHNAVPGAHECPSCHRCGWGQGIYTGDEQPRVRNGSVPPSPHVSQSFPIHPDQQLG